MPSRPQCGLFLSITLCWTTVPAGAPGRWEKRHQWTQDSLAAAVLGDLPGKKDCPRQQHAHTIPQPPQTLDAGRDAPKAFSLWKPSEAPAHASVAVCMAGQLRSLHQPKVLDNFRRHIVMRLRPVLFLHASRERSSHSMAAHDRSKVGRTTSEEFEWILTRLRPVGVRLMDDSVLLRAHNLTRRGDGVKCYYSSCPTLLLRFAGCAEDIERYETESRRQLPWILRTRPDLMWSCALPPLATWPMGRQVAWIYRDFIALYSRGVGLRALRLLDRIAVGDNCSSSRGGGSEPNMCLGAVLDEARAAWCELYEIPVYIQRTNGVAQRPSWIPADLRDDCPCVMCELNAHWNFTSRRPSGWNGSIEIGGWHVVSDSDISRTASVIVADARELKRSRGALVA